MTWLDIVKYMCPPTLGMRSKRNMTYCDFTLARGRTLHERSAAGPVEKYGKFQTRAERSISLLHGKTDGLHTLIIAT